jgi:hypothetical protein
MKVSLRRVTAKVWALNLELNALKGLSNVAEVIRCLVELIEL